MIVVATKHMITKQTEATEWEKIKYTSRECHCLLYAKRKVLKKF